MKLRYLHLSDFHLTSKNQKDVQQAILYLNKAITSLKKVGGELNSLLKQIKL